MSPLLMEFRLKISPNEPQITSGMPECLMAVAACSREEPVPKLNPERRMEPVRVADDVEGVREERIALTREAKSGS